MTEEKLDIATELCKQEGESHDLPERRKALIEYFASEDIIEEDLAEQLKEAVGFRDVLAHTYGPIVIMPFPVTAHSHARRTDPPQ